MRLGIIGLPQSGKTTVFNALTRGDKPIRTSGGRYEVHQAVVDVPDPRLDQLSVLFKPKKTTHAKVTYADIAGLEGSQAAISGELLQQLSQMDGFIHVVRCFEDPSVPHPNNGLDPARDIADMDAELLLNDLIAVERKLERLGDELRKGGGRDRTIVERERALFARLQETLSAEHPLRELTLSPEEEKTLSGYGFLSRKPVLVLLNLGEGQAAPQVDYDRSGTGLAALQGKLEMEIVQLEPEEAQVFMAEYGIETLGLNRVINHSYNLLCLLSFFTVGEDEVRAWTLPCGGTALEAAGSIHSDLAKGFIRAEVIPWDALLELGGLNEARKSGKLRLEGKTYPVQDGEIVHVRFNV